jgi:hypothetical protein
LELLHPASSENMPTKPDRAAKPKGLVCSVVASGEKNPPWMTKQKTSPRVELTKGNRIYFANQLITNRLQTSLSAGASLPPPILDLTRLDERGTI